MKKAAVIGFGYWGPNLCRVIESSRLYTLDTICEKSEARRKAAKAKFPNAELVSDYKKISDVDIVFIATPANSHLDIICFFANKNVMIFVEKPIVSTVSDFEKLHSLNFNENIFVSNPFAFHGLTIELKSRISKMQKDDLISFRSTRASMGIVRDDTDILFDLGPHDLSILKFLFGSQEIINFSKQDVELHGKVVTKDLNFQYGSIQVNLYLDWFSPVKKRNLTVITKSKIFDCDFASNKLDIYDVMLSKNSGLWEQNSLLVETFVPEPVEPLHQMIDSIFDDVNASTSQALEADFWGSVYETLFGF